MGNLLIEIIIRGCTDVEADICIDTMRETLEDTAGDDSFVPETSVTCLCSEDACNDVTIATINYRFSLNVPDCEY